MGREWTHPWVLQLQGGDPGDAEELGLLRAGGAEASQNKDEAPAWTSAQLRDIPRGGVWETVLGRCGVARRQSRHRDNFQVSARDLLYRGSFRTGYGTWWLHGLIPGLLMSLLVLATPHLRRFRIGRKYLEVLTAKMMLGMRKKVHQPRQNQKAF